MNWVAPIKDSDTLKRYEQELMELDRKYFIMFRMGVGTGLQVQDLLKICVDDVKGKDSITVYLGTKKIRRTYVFEPDMKQVIEEYTADKDGSLPLFLGHRGRAISREQAYRAMKSAGERIGIGSVGAQTMRKTFAWRYYKETGDITYLQELMNHGSASITYRYIGEKPRTEVNFKNMSAEENERSRLLLLTDDNGKNRIEDIIAVLRALCGELENPGNNDAFYGNTDCFLSALEELVQSYSKE